MFDPQFVKHDICNLQILLYVKKKMVVQK